MNAPPKDPAAQAEAPAPVAPRELTFRIFRYNPEDSASEPRMEAFTLDETPFMTLFIALNRIREEQAPDLQGLFVGSRGLWGA